MVAKFKVNVKKYGGVQLWKTTSNSDITGNIHNKNASEKNSCYADMSGAVYWICKDQECTEANRVGTITIGKEETDTSINFVGRTAENPFEAGVGNKYYVKEITPPTSGAYGLDQRVGTVSIDKATEKGEGWNEVAWPSDGTEGSTTVSKDVPKNDPVNILLKKVDSKTFESTPQGGAELKDAEFTVYYYDTTNLDTLKSADFKNHDKRVSLAKKKWVYKTQKDGTIDIQGDTPIAGSDETFKMADGKTNTLAIGTYVIEETYPPEGYINPEDPDSRCYIEVVTSDSSSGEALKTFHTKTFSPINRVTVTNRKGEEITYEGLGWNTWKPLNKKFSN